VTDVGGSGRRRPSLHLVLTIPHGFGTYLRGQPHQLSRSFDVSLVASPGEMLTAARDRESVRVRPVPMTRAMSPLRDLAAVWRLFRLFSAERPDVVQTYSPKAGLLGMLAARAAGVPVRVHGVIGMPLMESSGWRATVLAWTERLTYALATDLTCNSTGLRDWIGRHLTTRPVTVVGAGSVNGVECGYFRPPTPPERAGARHELGLAEDEVAYLFVGRFVADKGLVELIAAFARLHADHPRTRLVLVGDYDGERLPPATREAIESHPAVLCAGWRTDVRPLYEAADVLVLPSYREGMPNVVLEAAASGLPVVATDINGCNEIIHDGVSGLLVPPRDSAALLAAMTELTDPDRRAALGGHARELVRARYDHDEFCAALLDFYRSRLIGVAA
jgi:glycosyltransferase involved in cell wall biosynthesis